MNDTIRIRASYPCLAGIVALALTISIGAVMLATYGVIQ